MVTFEKLMEELLAIAKSRSAKFVSLTSNPKRKAAHKLYEKLGFVKVKTNMFKKIL